jgi:hypothetical protein
MTYSNAPEFEDVIYRELTSAYKLGGMASVEAVVKQHLYNFTSKVSELWDNCSDDTKKFETALWKEQLDRAHIGSIKLANALKRFKQDIQ